ncbi:hypothetical protein [Gordonia araii]|nr:hypothetical protein [Gordonia araii]
MSPWQSTPTSCFPTGPVPSRGVVWGVIVVATFYFLAMLARGVAISLSQTSSRQVTDIVASSVQFVAFAATALLMIAAANTTLRGRVATIICSVATTCLAVVYLAMFVASSMNAITLTAGRYRVVIGLLVTALLTTWFVARRQNLLTLILAPLGGVLAAFTEKMTTETLVPYTTSTFLQLTTYVAAIGIVVLVVVGIAWLAVALDKALARA